MIDPIETQQTWKVEPFDQEAWIAFSAKDRFLRFQQNDFIMRSLAAAGEDQKKYDEMIRMYLEAQYNSTVFEDSVQAAKWNRFIQNRARKAGLFVAVAANRDTKRYEILSGFSCFEHVQGAFRCGIRLSDGTSANQIGQAATRIEIEASLERAGYERVLSEQEANAKFEPDPEAGPSGMFCGA